MQGLTIKEMAEKLEISPNTVRQRLFQRGITPICKDAIYSPDALDQISDFQPKGFQPNNTLAKKKVEKKPTPDKNKPAKKPAKGKKSGASEPAKKGKK